MIKKRWLIAMQLAWTVFIATPGGYAQPGSGDSWGGGVIIEGSIRRDSYGRVLQRRRVESTYNQTFDVDANVTVVTEVRTRQRCAVNGLTVWDTNDPSNTRNNPTNVNFYMCQTAFSNANLSIVIFATDPAVSDATPLWRIRGTNVWPSSGVVNPGMPFSVVLTPQNCCAPDFILQAGCDYNYNGQLDAWEVERYMNIQVLNCLNAVVAAEQQTGPGQWAWNTINNYSFTGGTLRLNVAQTGTWSVAVAYRPFYLGVTGSLNFNTTNNIVLPLDCVAPPLGRDGFIIPIVLPNTFYSLIPNGVPVYFPSLVYDPDPIEIDTAGGFVYVHDCINQNPIYVHIDSTNGYYDGEYYFNSGSYLQLTNSPP